MGLDQYLSKRIYIGAEYKHRKITGSLSLKNDGKPIKINRKRVSEIIERVGYWRKSNQIHRWFVDNVQDGEDDCKEYYVSIEQLKELLDTCKEVKGDYPEGEGNVEKAQELLPYSEGFFFGEYEYDNVYFYQIESTIKINESVLLEHDECRDSDYYYKSSG